MGARAYYRVDLGYLLSAKDRGRAARVAKHYSGMVTAMIAETPLGHVIWGDGSALDDASWDACIALGDALVEQFGGTVEHGDDYESSGPQPDVPDSGRTLVEAIPHKRGGTARSALRAVANGKRDADDLAHFDAGDIARAGLMDFKALACRVSDPVNAAIEQVGLDRLAPLAVELWTTDPKGRTAWSDLAHTLKLWASHPELELLAVGDLLGPGRCTQRREMAAEFLRWSDTERSFAALVECVASQPPGKWSPVVSMARRSAIHRDGESALPLVMRQMHSNPSLSDCSGYVLDACQAGRLSVDFLWPILQSENVDRFLWTARHWEQPPPQVVSIVRALVGHPTAEIAALAAGILYGITPDEGLAALCEVDLTHLDSLSLGDGDGLPHCELLSRGGTPDESVERVRAAWTALRDSSGTERFVPADWPSSLAESGLGPRTVSDEEAQRCVAAEQAIIEPYRAWLRSMSCE